MRAMEIERRQFCLAAGMALVTGQAHSITMLKAAAFGETGDLVFSCARQKDHYIAVRIDLSNWHWQQLVLPGRGHAIAVHSENPWVVVCGRRPANWLLLWDPLRATQRTLYTDSQHHFYGHGCFDSSGRFFYTTEQHYPSGLGQVSVRDSHKDFLLVQRWDSGGIGPHELLFDTKNQQIVVANGGIRTHPASGRKKLNLHAMQPSLVRLRSNGSIASRVGLAAQQLSLRHLALDAQGCAIVACQDQTSSPSTALLYREAAPGQALLAVDDAANLAHRQSGYIGSVAVDEDGQIATTSPKSGLWHRYQQKVWEQQRSDCCGIASLRKGFLLSDGQGRLSVHNKVHYRFHFQFDNHLTCLA